MLVNADKSHEEGHVEFINYTGKWPCLCHGILTLKIDGVYVKFGNKNEDPEVQFPSFWISGGECSMESVEENPWIIDAEEIPEKYRKYAREFDEVFNENVEYGCCGGCR